MQTQDPSLDESINVLEALAGGVLLLIGVVRWTTEAFFSVLLDYPTPEFEEQYFHKNRDWIGL